MKRQSRLLKRPHWNFLWIKMARRPYILQAKFNVSVFVPFNFISDRKCSVCGFPFCTPWTLISYYQMPFFDWTCLTSLLEILAPSPFSIYVHWLLIMISVIINFTNVARIMRTWSLMYYLGKQLLRKEKHEIFS